MATPTMGSFTWLRTSEGNGQADKERRVKVGRGVERRKKDRERDVKSH